jgi:abhydrolase domain-containing protein 13
MLDVLGLSNIMPRWLATVIQCGTLLAVGLLTALYIFQEKILYVPIIPGVPSEYSENPSDYGLVYTDEWIAAEDGTRLQCWLIMPPGAATDKPPVMLFLQENAGNMSHRTPFFAAIASRLRCAIFVLGYRGYGQSEGSPNQQGLEMDSAAALHFLLQRTDIDTSRIVLFGRSLGGAVALHLAARFEDSLKAAIIENTFTSVEDMVPKVLPFLGPVIGSKRPLNFLVRNNKWRNTDVIQQIEKLPLLLMASANVRCCHCCLLFRAVCRWPLWSAFPELIWQYVHFIRSL